MSVVRSMLVAVAALAVIALANPVEAGCHGGGCHKGGGCGLFARLRACCHRSHCGPKDCGPVCDVGFVSKDSPVQGPILTEKQTPIQGPTEKQGPSVIQGPKVDNSLPGDDRGFNDGRGGGFRRGRR